MINNRYDEFIDVRSIFAVAVFFLWTFFFRKKLDEFDNFWSFFFWFSRHKKSKSWSKKTHTHTKNKTRTDWQKSSFWTGSFIPILVKRIIQNLTFFFVHFSIEKNVVGISLLFSSFFFGLAWWLNKLIKHFSPFPMLYRNLASWLFCANKFCKTMKKRKLN